MAHGAGECPFCEIVRGERDAAVVYRDESVVAFLDARPVFKGHTLVVPVRHVETLGELSPDEFPALMRVVQAVSRADENALEADGSFVAINNRVSQSVAHMHVHVVPRRRHDGLRGFFWPRTHYASDEEREAFAEVLRRGVNRELED